MKFRKPKSNDSFQTDSRDRWVIPYADLVTLLLALFVVLYASADKQRAAEIASNFRDDQTTAGEGILDGGAVKNVEQLKAGILSEPVLVKHSTLRETDNELTVSLAEAALFGAGEGDVASKSQAMIELLAAKLKDSKGKIRIEGHTDSLPISNGRYPSNWELSTVRASSVLRLLIQFGVKPERLSAAGYGGFSPIADNSTPEGRQLNRRVDVVVELKAETKLLPDK